MIWASLTTGTEKRSSSRARAHHEDHSQPLGQAAGADRRDRRAVWEADVSTGSEQRSVQINAANGDVVSNRIDD
jgi:hypothetical protein